MAVINGTINGVTLLSGSPAAGGGARRAYLLECSFGAFASGSDSATVTGVITAINNATRNGRTLTLRGAIPAHGGLDTAGLAVYFTGASIAAAGLANTTTTGDLTGSNQLSNAAGTITTFAASSGVGIIAIVDEA